MRAIPVPRMAMPMSARTPVNEEPEPEMPLPVLGAIGVLFAPGPGVFSPATASTVVFVAVGGMGVLVAVDVLTGVAAGAVGVGDGVGVEVGVLTMSGVQFVQSCVIGGGEALVFITQTSVSWLATTGTRPDV